MAWLEVHQALREHRKTWALAAELDMPEPHVSGHLIYLWLWGLDNAQEGQLPANVRLIERAAGWVGESGAFVRALVSTGFIDEANDGALYLHDWDIYAGKLISKRMADAQRKRDERRSASRPLDIHGTSDGHLSDGAGTNKPTNKPTEQTDQTEPKETEDASASGATSAPVRLKVAKLPERIEGEQELAYWQRILKEARTGSEQIAILVRMAHEKIGVPLEPESYARIGKIAKDRTSQLTARDILAASANHIDGKPLDYLQGMITRSKDRQKLRATGTDGPEYSRIKRLE